MENKELSIEGVYRIKESDIKRCADVAAKAFIDDESSKFLLSSNLTYKTLYGFYSVLFKAIHKKMYMFADSEDINGFVTFSAIKNSEISLFEFLRVGGLKVIFSQGLGLVFNSLAYENNCVNIRKKFISNDGWYIFQFGVHPEKQGMGVGSSVMKPVLRWFDAHNISCYLETQKNVNVEIYKHLGFSLKSVNTLPKKEVKQYAMLRDIISSKAQERSLVLLPGN